MAEDKKLYSDLASIVGKENASDSIYVRLSYGQDGIAPDLEPDKIPAAVVKPGSAQEVSKVVKYANERKIPIYIHGAGTAFKGSARPKRKGSIILSTERLNSCEFHEEDMYCEVGAGIVQYDLEKLLLERGYMLPMNMGSKFSATMGGAVAINTIGHIVYYFA